MDFRNEDSSLDARDTRLILFFYYLKATNAVFRGLIQMDAKKKLVAAAAAAGSVFMMAMTLFRARGTCISLCFRHKHRATRCTF